MKNIAGFMFMIFLLSCGNNNESAKNDLGDASSYVEHRENKRENKKNDSNINTSNSSNNEVNVSVENVISEGGPSIEFSNTVWDFGEINQGESVEHVFTFINNGTEPLIISKAKGSCGCLKNQFLLMAWVKLQ